MDGMDCELGKVGVECQVGVALLSVCRKQQRAGTGDSGTGELRAELQNLVTDRGVGRDRTCATQGARVV